MPVTRPEASSAEDAPQRLEGHAAFAEALPALMADARRRLRVLSFDLDPRLYGGAGVYKHCKDFLLLSRHSRLQILLHDTRRASQGHRLVDLGRRLSSFVEFRVLPEIEDAQVSDWVIIDESHLLTRQRPEALESRLWMNAPQRARQFGRDFDDLWTQSEPALEFRTIGLG